MKKKAKIISLVSIGVLATATAAANVAAIIFREQLNTVLVSYDTNSQEAQVARKESSALAEQIEDEGIVMVKNDNNNLPLSGDSLKKVNVFGWSSTQWISSGSGSGQTTTSEGAVAPAVDLLSALKDAGIETNTKLTEMYKTYKNERPYFSNGALNTYSYQFSRLYEPSISDGNWYDSDLLDEAKQFSDTAIVVIGRVSGESNDCPKVQYKGDFDATAHKNGTETVDKSRTYLEISTEEEELLTYVGKNYQHVVVIVNSTNAMELGFMNKIEGLDSCLVVGATGTYGAKSIPSVLSGKVNPSGKLADTYVYSLKSNPNYVNSGGMDTETYYKDAPSTAYPLTVTNGNVGESNVSYGGVAYTDYQENIYVGYKYYETADVEGVFDSVNNEYGKGYDGVVQYPFGYGLSYTDFTWEIVDLDKNANSTLKSDDTINITVRVTNTGKVKGQDVVELYYTPTWQKGQVEKASVNLADFAKTQVINPGEYEDVKLSLDVYDMASYDSTHKNSDNSLGAYILDDGDYNLSLRSNSHTKHEVLNNANSKHADSTINYHINSTVYETDPTTGSKVNNKFTGNQALDGLSCDGSDSEQNITYLSRADFKSTLATASTNHTRVMSDKLLAKNLFTSDDVTAEDNASDDPSVTWSKKNGLSLYDNNGNITELGLELGKDYNSSKWDDLLDQVNKDEAITLVTSGYGGTKAMDSIGKVKTTDTDGPNQLGSFGIALYTKKIGTGFPNENVLGQTFSKSLAYSLGLAIGKEGAALGYDGWYGPACNLHRSAFGGRNFEYYSEDSLLSGVLASQSIKACKNTGMYVWVKHLALYEQEWNRDAMYNWISEQALRETYLKPFSIAVKEGGATGIMTSYGRVGSIWAGASLGLLGDTGVLRGEWGYHGSFLTDYADHHAFMNGDQSIRHGGDLWMSGFMGGEFAYDTTSKHFEYSLRKATKNILYTILNASYTNSIYNASTDVDKINKGTKKDGFAWWVPALIGADVVIVAGLGVWLFFAIKKPKDKTE